MNWSEQDLHLFFFVGAGITFAWVYVFLMDWRLLTTCHKIILQLEERGEMCVADLMRHGRLPPCVTWAALQRLERHGTIISRWEEGTRWPRRRFYRLAPPPRFRESGWG